ncbi:MAG: class I SAM-dependent methyltransferase [Planctomycetota bacterium]
MTAFPNTSPGHSVSCRWCDYFDSQVEYRLDWKDERFATYSVHRCPQCTFAYVNPFPTTEQLGMLYDSIEYHAEDRQAGDFWKMDSEQVEKTIQKERYFYVKYDLPSTGTMFDIGAGWGTLIKYFSDQGWRASGMELAATQTKFAKEKLEVTVHQAAIEQLDDLNLGRFDLITMRHVLEHFANPLATLQSVRRRLHDSSKLIIEVPDYGSWDRRAYGDQWPGFGPYHLWYFSRSSLQKLLNAAGFEILGFKTFLSDRLFSKPGPARRILRSLANRLQAERIFSGRSIGLLASPTGELKP